MIELTSEMAERGAAVARSHARQLGTPMTVAVVDESGRLVLAVRGDGAGFFTTETARAKAVAAAAFRRPTRELAEGYARQSPFEGSIASVLQGQVLVSQGGVPIVVGGRVVGGIGCGGGTGAQDHECAEAGAAALAGTPPSAQPAADRVHERFMREAIVEAEQSRAAGGIPVGGVIVEDDRIVARGRNEAAASFDVTAHAETVAIRRLTAERRVVNPSYRAATGPLAGATLYTTYEPCPMCAWAICLAGLSAVVIGARFARVGDTRHGGYAIERLLGLAAQPLTVVSGVLEEECVRLRRPAEASR